LFDFKKWHPTFAQKHFFEVIPKKGFHDLSGKKNCRQKLHKNFSGKFQEIRAKIFRTTKNLIAPTPMLLVTNSKTH